VAIQLRLERLPPRMPPTEAALRADKVLDARARQDYRRRLGDLDRELDAADTPCTTPANARRLLAAIDRLESGGGEVHDLAGVP
jgi:hypothetical protein